MGVMSVRHETNTSRSEFGWNMAFLHIGISELPDDFHLSSFSNKEEVFNFVLVNGASCLVPLLPVQAASRAV